MESLFLDPEQQGAFAQAYHNQTNFGALGLGIFLLCAIAVLVVQRRAAMMPFLIVVSVISHAQRVVVFGLDFGFLRLLLLCGALRVLMRSEARGLRFNQFDAVVIASVLYGFGIEALREGAYVRSLGNIFDALGIYLLARVLIRDWIDLDQFAKYAAIVAMLIAPFFLIEWITGRNYFSLVGGVPEYSLIHHGRMRAKGAFAHMLIAGCFWVTLMPLIVARWWNPRASKPFVVAGVLAAVAVVVSTASSTPILGLIVAIGAACLFPARSSLRLMRWGFLALLVMLHLVMDKPVWHLIARVGVFGGSTGWHRFNLIDKFISNFDEWWLLGTNSTGHWAYNLEDVTNAFITQGIRGGLLALLVYIAVFALAFQRTGWLLQSVAKNRTKTAFAWALGVALFAHTVVHFGVGYFAQMPFPLYATFAMVATLAPDRAPVRAPRRARGQAPRAMAPAAPERASATLRGGRGDLR